MSTFETNKCCFNSRSEEYQYIQLISDILQKGTLEQGRNGVTKSIFGYMMRYSLSDNTIPIFTVKKTAWKTCLKELLWFIKGETNNKLLQNQNVRIWDGNTSREFLDSVGLPLYEEGIAGPIYGYQWRHFGAKYNCITGKPISASFEDDDKDRHNILYNGVDQLQEIINCLRDPEKRTSRRLIMTAWNPLQLNQMALPPCHVLCQFNVHDGNKLTCSLYQRSNDVSLGTSFNVASYSFLTHLLAKHCGLVAYEFIHFMGNCHIYEEHIEPMKEVLNREPFPFPKINISQIRENINDYILSDFEIMDYQSHDVIKMNMVA